MTIMKKNIILKVIKNIHINGKNIDSLLIGKIPFKKLDGYFNCCRDIIVKTKDRFIPLSIHDVDVNSTRPFHNSNYTKYKIL